jgi:predicted DNA binding CopG/RHH family protein
MSYRETIESTKEEQDSRELGVTEEFVTIAPEDVQALTDKHHLQPVSIRLEKSLIEDFKLIASMYGIGYQPLMRHILKRFADSEKKQILREAASKMKSMRREALREAASKMKSMGKEAAKNLRQLAAKQRKVA